VRLGRQELEGAFLDISIHTPAKGATFGLNILICGLYFNPHTREGCDLLTSGVKMGVSFDFNPHTREGCDD